MPETTKTFANIEILQGADYELTVTLDAPTRYYDNGGNLIDDAGKNYMVTICKDYTGTTDFGGRTDGAGTSSAPYRTQITETDVATLGKLVATDSGTTYTVTLNLYAQWTETLDDDFDGFWELVERDATTTPDSYARIAQGEVYVSKTASRYATTSTLSA